MVSKYPTLHLCVLYARARQTRIAVMGEEVAHLSDTLRIGQRVTKREKGKRWTCEGCQEQVKWAPLAEGGSGWRHLAENGKAIGKEGLCKGEKPRKDDHLRDRDRNGRHDRQESAAGGLDRKSTRLNSSH